MAEIVAGGELPDGTHAADGGHPPYLQHHFDTPVQQFEAGKLGMWLFLATEVLFFSGLFCAYAIYRHNHPEIFAYAHKTLSVFWGAANTLILIASSFTMALGVYCAQRSMRTGLIVCLTLTLLGAVGFMVIKGIEYSDKWHHGNLWGRLYRPTQHAEHGHGTPPAAEIKPPAAGGVVSAVDIEHGTTRAPGTHADAATHQDQAKHPQNQASSAASQQPSMEGSPRHAQPGDSAQAEAPPADALPAAPIPERTKLEPPKPPPAGLNWPPAGKQDAHDLGPQPENAHIFFGIYFCMTGLHGLHVVGGMVMLVWLLVGAVKGRYGAEYYTPVDLGGLYWHLVDLVWIYLFPLLYLIH